jgi:hypothetical protein
MRRAAAVAALAALVTAVPAAATPTAFPARNGELTFASDTADNVMQQLFTVLPDGSDRHAVTRLPGNHYLPSWSPDGRRVAFVLQGSIGVANADGTDERTIAPNEASPPVWSHDSRELAYGRFEPDSPTIPGLDPEPGRHRRDPHRPRQLAVVVARRLLVVHTDGTMEAEASDTSFEWPSWSPDGRFLAYTSVAAPSTIFVVRRDGTDRRQLTHETSRSSTFYPEWSPTARASCSPASARSRTRISTACRAKGAGSTRSRSTTTSTRSSRHGRRTGSVSPTWSGSRPTPHRGSRRSAW